MTTPQGPNRKFARIENLVSQVEVTVLALKKSRSRHVSRATASTYETPTLIFRVHFFQLGSSKKLIDMWRKGQRHLDMFWKQWFDEYVLSMREGTEKHLIKSSQDTILNPTC